MVSTCRRMMLRVGFTLVVFPVTTILNSGCTPNAGGAARDAKRSPDDPQNKGEKRSDNGDAMHIQYLEIVTEDVETACTLYSKMYAVTFGHSDRDLGGARTAKLANGGMLGIRAPMHADEKPVVRPYLLVKDIAAAVAAAAASGAEIAVPPMKIERHGTCAIVIQSGIESGLWQL
jgi:uncharacterized protein